MKKAVFQAFKSSASVTTADRVSTPRENNTATTCNALLSVEATRPLNIT
jgi:hypothetical protein